MSVYYAYERIGHVYTLLDDLIWYFQEMDIYVLHMKTQNHLQFTLIFLLPSVGASRFWLGPLSSEQRRTFLRPKSGPNYIMPNDQM